MVFFPFSAKFASYSLRYCPRQYWQERAALFAAAGEADKQPAIPALGEIANGSVVRRKEAAPVSLSLFDQQVYGKWRRARSIHNQSWVYVQAK